VNYGDPKFERGDLVIFCQETVGEMVASLGIVVSEPTLMFSHKWPNEEESENFWTYDVKVENTLFKMIPESFLRRLKNEDETENT
tara:strand:+ start:837 stop:1091 length:255 start_codon:yes stop_codon:yes gene_type:complete